MKILTLLILIVGTSISLSAQAAPAPTSFWLDAEEYNSLGDNMAELKGHVKVIRGLEQLTCDYARVNTLTKDVVAEGHVTYITPTQFIRADRFVYNFDTQKGSLYEALVQSDQVTLEGREIYKIGEKEYIIEDGSYTACTSCPASWRFTSTKVNATLGGYARMRNVLFKAYGVPFLYLPYLIVPVKSERQTGLLFPSFSFERGKYFHYQQPFFWAIDKSHDATITGHWNANRGTKGELEYRYVLNENSRGTLTGSYMKDKYFAESPRVSPQEQQSKSIPRWALHYDHHYDLPGRITNNVSVNMVRDLQHPVDFPSEMTGAGDPALESRLSFSKNSDSTHTSVETTYYQNLLRSNALSTNEASIHKVPELRYSLLEKSLFSKSGGLLFAANFDYTNFTRQSSAFADGNGNGTFDPSTSDDPALKDFVRTGQRFFVEPKLLYPFRVGRYFDLVPSVTFREVYYQFGYGSNTKTSRQYLRTELTGRTRFAGVYGDEFTPKAIRYKHEVQPEITYSYIPYLFKENHLFFGPQDEEPVYLSRQPINESDQIQFDYFDRVQDRHIVTYGVTNKIIRKKPKRGDANYREIVRHSLTQSFDIFDATRTENPTKTKIQPFSEITSLLNVKLDYFGLSSEVNYYPYQAITSNSSRMTISDARGDYFSLAYLYSFVIPRKKEAPVQGLSETISSGAGVITKHLNMYGNIQYSPTSHSIQSYDYSLLFKPPGECLGILFTYRHTLGLDNDVFFFTFPIYFGAGKQFTVGRPGYM